MTQVSCSHPDSLPKASCSQTDASTQESCSDPDASRSRPISYLNTTRERKPLSMNHHEPTWLPCDHPGCGNGINADAAHLPNLTAPGGWTCREHDDDEVTC